MRKGSELNALAELLFIRSKCSSCIYSAGGSIGGIQLHSVIIAVIHCCHLIQCLDYFGIPVVNRVHVIRQIPIRNFLKEVHSICCRMHGSTINRMSIVPAPRNLISICCLDLLDVCVAVRFGSIRIRCPETALMHTVISSRNIRRSIGEFLYLINCLVDCSGICFIVAAVQELLGCCGLRLVYDIEGVDIFSLLFIICARYTIIREGDLLDRVVAGVIHIEVRSPVVVGLNRRSIS